MKYLYSLYKKYIKKIIFKKMTSTSINDFKIEKILGRGSFGSVYLVRRKQDQKIYALKTVTFEKLNKRDQENSLNEVRILASINHPNVIGYKEAFWDDSGSSLNIVMEFADDGDLESKIIKMKKEGGMFNESLIWSYSIQMIEGLNALHDKKIMHRDIKSANIFLVKDKHQCKIGDMNVSKVIKEKVLRTQTGTPYYASPEVWRDEPYSYKSDLWSIGCVIYELCALRPPFKGKDLDELYANVCKGNIERISHIYSEDLWKMILMLLQVDVKKRVDCKGFLDSKLIMKKIKEMKENNSECKDLEKNKNSFSGTLLKTIKFKDYKDIKSQLPTKKNYDINLNNINPNSSKENINKNEILLDNNYINKNINIINNHKKNYFCDNLIEKLTNNINNNNQNLNHNIINNSNNINNYYYINYSPNYNQCFPTKINNNITGKNIKSNENYIFKTDINDKDINILEKIDLNSIRNEKKKLIQKNEIFQNYSNNYINKKEEDIKKKKINERFEKKLILQKQRQKEKERYTEYNKLKEENRIEKSESKKKINHRYYNKIKNIEDIKVLKKRPASSSRIISSSKQKKMNNNNYYSINENKNIGKKNINKINDIINDKNNKDNNKKNNLCIQIFETERNIKKKDISNMKKRAKTPLNNSNQLKIIKKNNKSQTRLNYINNSQLLNKNNNNINSVINLNCMTSPEEDKPKYDKINKIKLKNKNISNEFWERKNVKIIKKNEIKRKINTHQSNSHLNNERALSATPNKRNPRLNPKFYDNNSNANHYQKKIFKNYDDYINKDSYAYKITKKNNYRHLHGVENNQQIRPITSVGNEYYENNNNNYKKKFNKKNIINNELKSNICSKIKNQNIRKINAIRPNSCKLSGHDNNKYIEKRKNYRRYNPDITDPELLMMVNPIKIKDNYKNSQKNSLNITVNNNIVNQNIFLQHIKSGNININTNGNNIENKEMNKDKNNINNKYNHLQIFKNLYMNNERNNNDEPIKVINILNQ